MVREIGKLFGFVVFGLLLGMGQAGVLDYFDLPETAADDMMSRSAGRSGGGGAAKVDLDPFSDTYNPGCETGALVGEPGSRRVALLVGINNYLSPDIKDLRGPLNDVRGMYHVLTNEKGYAFPKENVCVLRNRQASNEGFRKAFKSALVDRVVSGDRVVIFFAGHGGQVFDLNNDEPDEKDETLVLYDSKASLDGDGQAEGDLVDDEFNEMLQALAEKTSNVTVILDSCNSGSATRGQGFGYTNRFFERDLSGFIRANASRGDATRGDGGFAFAPHDLDGFVILAASEDGKPAVEKRGQGIFTTALVEALSASEDVDLTFAQLEQRIAAIMSGKTMQKPAFHGDTSKLVFSTKRQPVPLFAWRVEGVERKKVMLVGLPVPGMGLNAELHIFDGAVTLEEAKNPANAKARVKVVDYTDFGAETIYVPREGVVDAEVKPGDIAVLHLVSDTYKKLSLRLGKDGEHVMAAGLRQSLLSLVSDDSRYNKFLTFSDDEAEFEIAPLETGSIEIVGSEGKRRSRLDPGRVETHVSFAESILGTMLNHAKQRALLSEWTQVGEELKRNESIQVRLVSYTGNGVRPRCKEGIGKTTWSSPWNGVDNKVVKVPLCQMFQIQIRNNSKVTLHFAGSVLSSDGDMYQLPQKQLKIQLEPGSEWTFLGPNRIFEALPSSLGKIEKIFILGMRDSKDIQWNLLRTGPTERGLPPAQAVEQPEEKGTYTVLNLTVVANPDFGPASDQAVDSDVASREYTIPEFDISPYVPHEKTAALSRVLAQADMLARRSVGPKKKDGVHYHQHNWCEGSWEANLDEGIDCSRSVWYAFRKAGLKYNRYTSTQSNKPVCLSKADGGNSYMDSTEGNDYLATADMARHDGPMADQFVSCSGQKYQLGDVLVYRDMSLNDQGKPRNVGHTVMVIDYDKRVAWGSHGWDGNEKLFKMPKDTGVEYQKIKMKTDWQRWDRSTMTLQACWRHKDFISEAEMTSKNRGQRAVAVAYCKNPDDAVCAG